MTRTYFFAVSFLSAVLLVPSASGQQPIPQGDEQQVNSFTTGPQGRPAVARGSSGGFVVVWESYGSVGGDSSYDSIQGQRFGSDGTSLGGQFQVNTYTTDYQWGADIASDGAGAFVVVWTSYLSTTDDYGSIQGQRYASDGTSLGGQFQVSSYVTGYQWDPAVAVDADGDFVVVWTSDLSATDGFGSIQGQRYASDGTALGSQFQVNSYVTGYQRDPAVAVDDDGDFVVAWTSYGSSGTDSSYTSIQGQRYASDGTPRGGEIQVNTFTTDYQWAPGVALDPDGDFVVVWDSYGSSGGDASSYSIQMQRFASDGSLLGSESQVNAYTTSAQWLGAVSRDAVGDFVVVWESYGSSGTDTSDWSVQARRFASNGSALGGELQVNSYTTDYQLSAAVALDARGHFVVAWQSYGSAGTDSSSYSVQAQRFVGPIFADGFESGDTTAWSATVP
jgi:hypothetical protein